MATRWRSPPESSAGRRRSLPERPRRASRAARRASSGRPWPRRTGSATFSATSSVSTRLKLWKTTPTWRRRKRVAAPSDIAVRSAPPISTRPVSGASSPASRCSSVDLPEPLAPITASKAPGASSKERPRRTSARASPEPKDLPSAVARTAGGVEEVESFMGCVRKINVSENPFVRKSRLYDRSRTSTCANLRVPIPPCVIFSNFPLPEITNTLKSRTVELHV